MISPREQYVIDDKFQREMRDRFLLPHFYDRRYPGRYQIVPADTPEQKRGIDTMVDTPDGVRFIEEKIVRFKGAWLLALALETHSCTLPGYERLGWMEWCEADFLLYCFTRPAPPDLGGTWLECFFVDFPGLKGWFAKHKDTLEERTLVEFRSRPIVRKLPFSVLQRSNVCWERLQLP